ncbi:MAG TPA: hypothetical protein PLW93_02025 [Candidatus Absconditabacterales bacterium]|nr:hypothetical protein [Candidatus Absconditabacterales bacterium]
MILSIISLLSMARTITLPQFSMDDVPLIVAGIQKTEPSCRGPFQPPNSEYWGTYSVGDGREDCANIYYKNKLLYHGEERHVHFVYKFGDKIFAAVGDDLPYFEETAGYGKLLMSSNSGKTRDIVLQNDRANFTAMRKIGEWYYFGEDAGIKKPTSRILKSKDLITFTTVFTLPKEYAGNIVGGTYFDKKYWIGTFVDRKGMIPSLWSSTDGKKRILEKDYGRAKKDRHGIYRITIKNNKLDIAYNDK